MTPIRRLSLATLVLSLAAAFAQAGEPAPDAIGVALKQLAPATLTVDRVESVKGSDTKFLIAGRADRNATISTYLRTLDTSSGFQRPELLQVALNSEGRPMFEIMVERKADADATTAPSAASTSTKGNKPTVYRCKIDGRDVFQSLPCPTGSGR